jgi:X-Pro dipeptidyl-peptidase
MHKKLITFALVVTFILLLSSVASADFVKGLDKNLELYPGWIVNGQTQPIFTYADAIKEIVYVEVPCDTDRDGKRDRISLYIMRPNAPGFLAPALLEHSPYHNGTIDYAFVSGTNFAGDNAYMSAPFRYKDNWPIHKDLNDPKFADTTHLTYDDIKFKGTEAWNWPWTNAAFTANSWYTGVLPGQVPAATVSAVDGSGNTLYEPAPGFNFGNDFISTNPNFGGSNGNIEAYIRYYLPRGYALLSGQLLGNRDSDGISNSMHMEEVLSAMAIIKWLNGEAKAYTSRRGNVEVKADWANGHAAMSGTSYPGTTPLTTAASGVKGLKAVMPQACGTNWYDVYRAGGAVRAPGGYGGEDINLHAAFNFSRWQADSGLPSNSSTTVYNNNFPGGYIPKADGEFFPKAIQDAYFATQAYMMEGQGGENGDYNTEWDARNLLRNIGHIGEDVGVIVTNGLMDWNLKPKNGYQLWLTLEARHKGPHKIFTALSGHASQSTRYIPGTDGVGRSLIEWWHMWMDHFLLGLDNNVVDLLPNINIANNRTGEIDAFKQFPLPGIEDQKIYLVPAESGKAGALSYNQPAATKASFRDMTVLEQLNAPAAVGSAALSETNKTTIAVTADGNRRANAAQALFAENRFIGVDRVTNVNNEAIFAAADKPIEGRLLYLSEPLKDTMRLNGVTIVQLLAAPDKGVGNLTAALVELGRQRRFESGRRTASLVNVTVYSLPYGGGLSNSSSIARYDNPSTTGAFSNYKYVTTGWADVQNPNHDGKIWTECADTNYTPNFYFQTTKIVPGKYYPYTIELEPYDYTFEAGNRIGIMVFGTDPDYSQLYDECCTAAFDIQLGPDSYAIIPLALAEPSAPITLEVGSSLVELGDTVDISYSVKGNDFGFTTLELELPFDSSICAPAQVTPAPALAGAEFAYSIAGDILKITVTAADNIAGDGALFTVTYQVKETAPRVFNTPLNVKVIATKFGSFIDKTVDLEVNIKAGALKTYDFTVYFVPDKSKLVVGDTVAVDVMLAGGKNYTQVATEITFDAGQLEYLGYNDLQGWAAAVTKPAANKIAVRSVPGMNMVTGAPCLPAQKIVTLKFKATGAFTGDSLDAAIAFASTLVSPAGGVTGALTAPGKPATITWLKVGNEFLQDNLKIFPDMWDVEKNQTNPVFSNSNDRVICEEVWIEVPIDTDGDGKRDLIRATFRRPIETKPENGGLKTPVIAQLTPYTGSDAVLSAPFGAKVDTDYLGENNPDTRHVKFEDLRYNGPRYKDLLAKNFGDLSEYGIPAARVPLGSQIEGAPTANWNPTAWHAYFIPLGYTCASLEIIGSTYGEGFLSLVCYEESLCSAALVDWLNGRLPGYTSPTSLIKVEAPYWATGEVAMSGQSYGGELPLDAAITGVEGLRTIIPFAAPSNLYDYYRANGLAYAGGGWQGTDVAEIMTGCFGRGWAGTTAPTSPVAPTLELRERFYKHIDYLWEKQERGIGDYSAWWDEKNIVSLGDDIRKDLGIIVFHGFNDDNVKFKHAALIQDMAQRYGITAKYIFHQGMHMSPHNHNGLNFYQDTHKWFDYYLYGVENGMPDDFPDIRVQSNIDIGWENYDKWPAGEYNKLYPVGNSRVGSLTVAAPVTTAELSFKDSFILGLTRPEYSIPAARPYDPYYTANATKYSGHVSPQMAGSQYYRWRNYMLGGADSTAAWTTPWTAPASGVTYDLTAERTDRLLYVMDITEDMTISGTIKMTAQVAADKKVGAISAMLVDFGSEIRFGTGTTITGSMIGPHGQSVNLVSWSQNASATPAKIISRGSVDVQNPNYDGKIWSDCFETNWMAPYTYQTTDIAPGTYYPYTWEMDVMNYTVLAGHKLILMIYGSDPEYTSRPYNPTGFTVAIGPSTYISLPLVKANIAPVPAEDDEEAVFEDIIE